MPKTKDAVVASRLPRAAIPKIDAACAMRRVTRSTYIREATLAQVARDLRAALEEQPQPEGAA